MIQEYRRKIKRILHLVRTGEWGMVFSKASRRLDPIVKPFAELRAIVSDAVSYMAWTQRFRNGELSFQDLVYSTNHADAGSSPKNLIWIMLDALREDIFREYLRRGGFAQLAPMAYFTRAFVQGSWTYPSVFSFLTGRYPFNCGVSEITFEDGTPVSHCTDFDDSVPTIFDLAKSQGYQVGSILDGWGFTVRTTAGQAHREDQYFEDRWGWFYGQGKRFLTLDEQRSASVSFLEKHAGKSPFLLFVRSLYTHSPYRDIFPSPDYVNFLSKVGWRFRLVEGFIRGLQRFEEVYLKSLLRTLDQKGVLQDTIIVLCSDHGEMLWDLESDLRRVKTTEDEEKWRHQLEPYNSLIRVPLLLSGGGMRGYHSQRFRLIDLVPTLLEEMSIPFSAGQFDGIPLSQEHHRPIYADSAGYGYGGVAFQDNGRKLLCSRRLGAVAYEIRENENESVSLRQSATVEIDELRRFLHENRRQVARAGSEQDHEAVLQRRLQDLGYIE